MKGLIFVVFVATSVFAYEIITDGEQEYLLVPLNSQQIRTKRQTGIGYDSGSKRIQLSHTGTLVNNDNHHLAGTGSISHGIKNGPLSTGGSLQYSHIPSGSSFGAGAQHTNGFGTDVGVGGRYNFVNKPNTQAFVQGQYDRHYGGLPGTGKPNYGVHVGLNHRF
nr:attacin-B-like [Onthophagus taurus]